MLKTNEKGVTLITLAITIILLLILASIGITSGVSTINYTKFSKFKNELQILQTKVNELNQNNENNINNKPQLTDTQKNILNETVISNIIYKNATNEEKEKIQNGFRYCDATYIQNELGLESIKRDYLINVEYRYVICYEGIEYKGIRYYMIDQIDDSTYNVRYKDKNSKEGNFDFTVTDIRENDRWKIEISNITYDGYINNWQVKYKLEGETFWNTTNSLNFYVTKPGKYDIKLFHNEIEIGPKQIELIDEPDVI